MIKIFGIQGSFEHDKEIIEILKEFGGENTLHLKASREELIYYIDQLPMASECIIRAMTSPFGGKVYKYSEFINLIKYHKEDYVKRRGFPALYKISQLKWEGGDVYYKICDGWFPADELIPTSENSDIVEENKEKNSFLYQEGEWVTVYENGSQVCDGKINEFLIDRIITDPVTQEVRYLVNGKLYPARQISRIHPHSHRNDKNEIIDKETNMKEISYEIPKDYEFDRVENGKVILKSTLPEIPDTYEKCCKIMGISPINLYTGLNTGIELNYIMRMNTLNQLFTCRDAFWKVLTPEPWKPEGDVCDENQFCLWITDSIVFRFPTSWHMDKFMEKFKYLIDKLDDWK